jgi:hypothetical protein
MVKKLKLSLRVDRKRWNNSSGELADKVFVTVDWFGNESFRKDYSDKAKKKFVKEKLKRTSRGEISDRIEIGEKEEVVVTEQGRHDLDQALFHETIEMPKNLIDGNKKQKGGSSLQW